MLSLKRKCQEVLELAPRKGKNSLGPRPSNEILVSLRAFVENFNFLWEFPREKEALSARQDRALLNLVMAIFG